MRHFISLFVIFIFSCGLVVSEANAKRFSSVRSYSMSRSSNAAGLAAKKQSTNSRLKGALTGFLAGTLLASFFMGNGFGGLLLLWLMAAVLTLFIINYRQRKKINNAKPY